MSSETSIKIEIKGFNKTHLLIIVLVIIGLGSLFIPFTKCPVCKGLGFVWFHPPGTPAAYTISLDCTYCSSDGHVSFLQFVEWSLGLAKISSSQKGTYFFSSLPNDL